MNKDLIGEIEIPKHQKFVSVLVLLEGEPSYVEAFYGGDGKFRFGYDEDAIVGVEKWMPMPSRDQPSPLKIGRGVTVENIGFGSEQERKPYLVFDNDGYLTEVNLIDLSLVSKRRTYSVLELEDIGVRIEREEPKPRGEVDGNSHAPKQQGDVVAWRHTMHFEEGCGCRSEFTSSPKHPFGKPDIDYDKTFLVTTDPLYAEPPAPVAVVLPERRETSPEYPHLSDTDIERNDTIDEMAKLNGLKP